MARMERGNYFARQLSRGRGRERDDGDCGGCCADRRAAGRCGDRFAVLTPVIGVSPGTF